MRTFFILSDAVTGLLLLVGCFAISFVQENHSADSLSLLPAILLGLAFLALVPCNIRPSRRHVWIRTLTYAVGFVYVGMLLASSYPQPDDPMAHPWHLVLPWMLLLVGNVIAYPLCVRPNIKRLQNR